ncbi:MAG: peptidase S10 [Candidatus Latescibacteria bacterium]|nr:peptidase S10 [Candidatus Latescibacterota bacterium]
MSREQEAKKEPQESAAGYKGTTTQHRLNLSKSNKIAYTAVADWTVLRRRGKELARIFHVAYIAEGAKPEKRPVTFVFNGGPGAASAYLHMGALGPRRAVFGDDGSLPPPPAQLVDNAECWLRFTDLVFIDPVGTGFSRPVEEQAGDQGKEKKEDKENEEFWELNRDLESLGEFIQRFLSQHGRWTSPVFIAGESYGGFRVAKLARKLQEDCGVGLNGAVLISPAIEFASLLGSDYDMSHWMELFPSMAASAWVHGRGLGGEMDLQGCLEKAEAFARNELLTLLGQGASMEEGRRQRIYRAMARFTGLDEGLLQRSNGRVYGHVFARQLLADQRRYCGLYDASLTAVDPFPDRLQYEGPDPTLMAIDRVFRAAINAHLRQGLGVETELDYELLSLKVNRAWKQKGDDYYIRQAVGAMDDLRYGMVLNPYMQVAISHGYYDLITPYFSTERLVGLMKLDDSQRDNLTVQHYQGGHMFYTWAESRRAFAQGMRRFYRRAVGA